MSKQQVQLKEKDTNILYKIGDKAKIVRNAHSSGFIIGETVTVIEKSDYDYLCESKSGARWYCQDDNFTNG